MVYLDIKSHLKLFVFNQDIGTLSSTNRILRYFSIFCCLMYITFFSCFSSSGVRGFITAEGVHKVEQIYEVLPGFTIGMKILLLYPHRKRLDNLLNTFDGIELTPEGWTVMLKYVTKFKGYFKNLVRVSYSTCCLSVVSGVMLNQLPFANEGLPFIDEKLIKMDDWTYWPIAVHQSTCMFYGVCVNMFMDGFPALIMALVSGYLEGIALKVRRIGWMTDSSKAEGICRQELIKCADMHQKAFE